MQLAAVGGCGSSTEVFAITMLTPTGQNQGEFYTPTMVTEEALLGREQTLLGGRTNLARWASTPCSDASKRC
jgi:hypothetical protein